MTVEQASKVHQGRENRTVRSTWNQFHGCEGEEGQRLACWTGLDWTGQFRQTRQCGQRVTVAVNSSLGCVPVNHAAMMVKQPWRLMCLQSTADWLSHVYLIWSDLRIWFWMFGVFFWSAELELWPPRLLLG